jgi:hypothetical protein
MSAVRFSEVKISGRMYRRYEFDELEELEEFFLHHVAFEQNISSKVIGKVLLIWERQVMQ